MFKISVPIVLSNATIPLLGVVDTGVVGQLGEAAPIGAVGLGAVIITSIYWIFGFLRMGTVSLAGQAVGDRDSAELSAVLSRALLIAIVSGGFVVVTSPLLFAVAFSWNAASAEVEALTTDYLYIRVWTAPFAICVYALSGWLVALERTGGVFWIQLVMNCVNMALSAGFVLLLDWGVEGVALGTALAEILGFGVALWFCRDAFADTKWRAWGRVFMRSKLRQMLLLNADILIRSALLIAIMTSFTFLGTGFGDVTLAANHVLLQFILMTSYALDGFAYAAESLVARSFGRGDPAQVRRASLLTTQWGALAALVFSLSFWLFGPAIIDLLAKSPDVQETARAYLPWMILAPILAVGAFMLDGIFVGAGRGTDMRNMMILSALIYVLAVFVLIPTHGNDGLWGALLLSYVARSLTLLARYPALEQGARHHRDETR